ncbi:MAG TPA: ATP-binding protein [Myxococcota bacterium]|nr:ATP-binding protein [Myxococcota bacterium]
MDEGRRRSDTASASRAATRRRRRLAPGKGAARGAGGDAQSLLTHALDGLCRELRCDRAVAWARGLDGGAIALAAKGEVAPPSDAEFAALAALEGPSDLAGAAAPRARASGLAAAAPVRGSSGATLAVLLVGPDGEGAGPVRPRTLAALAAAAERLAGPLAAAAGEERLARLDGEVRRLDRLASLGELVAEIVHEIRNPLVSVKTFLQLLPERAGEPEFRERFRELASEELRRIERLIDLVLAHARPAQAPRELDQAPLAASCESVAQLVAHRAADLGVKLSVDAPDAELAAALAPDALRQIVLNLVLNALDVTPRGGCVRLAARAAEGGVELRVEDQGPGIAPALRERVFEPFYSTKPAAPGGLGLSISRRIAEEAGGTLEVEERPGGGSSFALRLPAAPG